MNFVIDSNIRKLNSQLSNISQVILWVCLHSAILFADFSGLTSINAENRGQTVAQFLTLPTSSHSLSTGGITLSGHEKNSSDIAISPAATAYTTSYMFSATHLEWLMGLRNEYIGALFPLLDHGTLGFYTRFFSYGKFDYARDIDEYPINPKAFDFNGGVSYAREVVPDILSTGISLSYLYSNLDGDKANALNMSFDIFTKPLRYITGNIFVRNFGTPVKYNQTKELQPFQMGASVELKLLSFEESAPDKIGFSIKLGAEKESDSPVKGATSITFLPIKQLKFNAGYEYSKKNTNYENGISAGMGLNIGQYGVEGGWKYQSADFGSVWAVTVKYNTVEIIPKSAKDYYKIALRYFNRKRFRNAIIYAKKAINLNPNMWRAHSLISMSISALKRNRGNEIGIIFTGNIGGQIKPDKSNTPLCGGIARIATVINSEKNNFKYHLTIEGGNQILSNFTPEKIAIVDEFMKVANYDVAFAGASELRYQKLHNGSAIYNKSIPKLTVFTVPEIKSNENITIKYVGKYKIAMSAISLKGNIKENNKILLETQKLYQSIKAQHAALSVLVVSGEWQAIKQCAETINGIDIIIANSIKEPLQKPVKINNSVVVSAGYKGKYVGSIAISFTKSKRIQNINCKLLQVNRDIKPVAKLAHEIRKFSTAEKIKKNNITTKYIQQNIADGVFPFISTRNGAPQVFLKILKKHIEYPLSDNFDTLKSYDLSFDLGKILTVTKDSVHTYLKTSNLTGNIEKEIATHGNVTEAKFSPDSKWIYFCAKQKVSSKNNDIFRIPVYYQEDEKATLLFDWKKSNEEELYFSHDSKNILFTSTRSGKKQIYIAGADGSTRVRLTDDNYASSFAAKFSPLDKYIGYISDKNNFNGQTDLWVIDRANGKHYRITTLENVNSFMWLDDKGTILYSAGKNLSDFNIINILTGESRKFILPTETPKKFSEKNPTSFYFNGKKKILFTKEYMDGRKELFMANTNGSAVQKVVSSQGNNFVKP